MRTHRVIAFIAFGLLAISVLAISVSNSNKPASASTASVDQATPLHLRLDAAMRKERSSLVSLGREAVTSIRNPPVVTPAQSAFLVAMDSLETQQLENAAAWYSSVADSDAAAWYGAVLASEQAPPPPPPQASSGGGGTHYVSQVSPGSSGGGGGGANWAAIRQCESGGNYSEDSGNGYYGAYQFSEATWQSLGYSGNPADAPPAVQDAAAQALAARSGMGQWPVCGSR